MPVLMCWMFERHLGAHECQPEPAEPASLNVESKTLGQPEAPPRHAPART